MAIQLSDDERDRPANPRARWLLLVILFGPVVLFVCGFLYEHFR